ncbi:MAG: hypothetical protein CHACPFDD_01322 [Phycisphaerae bacterium]|nr:hypothetical protein [Phycisphaerae bacterium]
MSRGGARYNLECRDAVHGFVYLSEAEWAIVDCPTYQRLRDIRQLAMAHLVYPGATHARFEHSLGCVHLSDRIYSALRRQVAQETCPNFAQAFRANDEQEQRGLEVLRLAALLHDLGHTPFSHSGEHLMPERQLAGGPRKVKHEDMTEKLIRETEIRDKLESLRPGTTEEVIAVATSPEQSRLPERSNSSWFRFLNDILTGELGADRMDYLLRDATHSGQSAGLFDYRKLIDSMTIVPPPQEAGDEYRLGLDGAGWLVAEQMVAARYLMYVALYFHKTKRIYEIHLERFLARWLEARFKEPFFPVDKPDEYVKLTDSLVWAGIYEAACSDDRRMRTLARPFVDRTHFRLAFELLPVDNIDAANTAETLGQLMKDAYSLLDERIVDPQERMHDAYARALERLLKRRTPRVWNKSRFDKLVQAANTFVRDKFGSHAYVLPDQASHHAAKFF